MDSAKCAKCQNEFPTSGMMRLDGQRYCAVCGEQAMENLQHADAQAVADAKVCQLCGNGGALQSAGGIALCPSCEQAAYNRDFPKWLKLSLLASLVLLAFALAHGTRYFAIGRKLYHGEKALKKQQYEAAQKELKDVIAFAPECKKCLLLYAKAALLAGDPASGYDAVKDQKFEEDDDFRDVDQVFARVSKGMNLVAKSAEQADADQTDDAIKTLEDAKRIYPEFKGYPSMARSIEVAAAFNKKDYDKFLALEQEEASLHPESPMTLGGIASALACKYAVTGDVKFAEESRAALEKAKLLTGADPEAQKNFQEYSERIEYRLKTRDIIDKKEYDKRFRPELAEKKEAK